MSDLALIEQELGCGRPTYVHETDRVDSTSSGTEVAGKKHPWPNYSTATTREVVVRGRCREYMKGCGCEVLKDLNKYLK